MRREAATAALTASSGETLAIRPLDPEFWNDDGPIEYNTYVAQHDAYLNELLSKGEIAYHYTTLDGLRGIVQQGAIWASDIRLLNDRFELKYALAQMRRILAAEGKVGEQPLDAVFHPGRTWQFVTCFSRARDQLSQWRAYGARVGVSIGFHKEHLKQAAAKAGGEIVECRYLAPDEFSSVRQQLDPIVVKLTDPKVLNPQGHLVDMPLQDELTRYAVKLASSIKHPSFQEEREDRIAVSAVRASDAEFRSSPQSLVPYLRVDLDGRRLEMKKRLPYTNYLGMLEILVWPSNADDQTLDAIEMLLSGAGSTLVSRSASPYRT